MVSSICALPRRYREFLLKRGLPLAAADPLRKKIASAENPLVSNAAAPSSLKLAALKAKKAARVAGSAASSAGSAASSSPPAKKAAPSPAKSDVSGSSDEATTDDERRGKGVV